MFFSDRSGSPPCRVVEVLMGAGGGRVVGDYVRFIVQVDFAGCSAGRALHRTRDVVGAVAV